MTIAGFVIALVLTRGVCQAATFGRSRYSLTVKHDKGT